MTDVLTARPRMVRVKDIAQSIQYGHTASAITEAEGPRFLRITDIQDGQVNWSSVPSCEVSSNDVAKYRLCPGDVVFARTGATTGKSYLIGECPEAIFASYLIRLRVVADAIDPRYLAAFFQSPDYWSQIEGGKRGIGQPNVNAQILGDIVMPLPPLSEQRKIVDEIETQLSRLEAGVSALKRAQANLKRYRAAILKAACEGRLVPTEAELARAEGRDYETGGQLLNRILSDRKASQKKAPTQPDEMAHVEVPEGWSKASVDQLRIHITSGSRDWSKYYGRGTGTFILAQNVRPMRLDLAEKQAVEAPKGDAEAVRTLVQRDDLLVTIVGAKTGDTCRVTMDLDEHYVCQSVALVRLANPVIAPFVELWLAGEECGQKLWETYIYGQGRPHLSFEQLKMTPVPLPPLAEQKRIVAEVERRLSVVDELETTLAANLRRATRLRQSVLQAAFSSTHD